MDTTKKLSRLMRETEDLLDRIGDERSPQIERVREKLLDSLEKTKMSIRESGSDDSVDHDRPRPEAQLKVRDLAGSLNDYVRRYPWLALATGVLVASSVGILATHATKRSYSHDQ